jgi:hypothetical protein
MNIRFVCPICAAPGRLKEGQPQWRCPGCDHLVRSSAAEASLPCCALCGNAELYRKKDFPHALGMGILVAACLASSITYALYAKVLTWTILLGSAAIDGLLYLWVNDVVVCYRCSAQHRGVAIDPERHRPFELTVHERYRQERLRLEVARQEEIGK